VVPPSHQTARFFMMLVKLPMELQMVVCNHSFGINRELVARADSEGFLRLARYFERKKSH